MTKIPPEETLNRFVTPLIPNEMFVVVIEFPVRIAFFADLNKIL
jgi:hypothetical protein